MNFGIRVGRIPHRGDCGRARSFHNDLVNQHGRLRKWGTVAVALIVLTALTVW